MVACKGKGQSDCHRCPGAVVRRWWWGSDLAGIIETGVITCGHLGGRRKIRQCRGWEPSNLAHNGHYLIRITLQAIRKM